MKKDKTKKKEKLGLKAVIKDTGYAIKIVTRTSPFFLVMMMLESLTFKVMSFFTSTYVLRYIINSYEDGIDFKTVALSAFLMIMIPSLANGIICPVRSMFQLLMFNNLERKMRTLLVDKTRTMDD